MAHRHCYLRIVIFLTLGCWSILLPAVNDPLEDYESPGRATEIEEPEEWKEKHTQLPHYPRDRDLVEVPIDGAPPGFHYAVDARTLAVGDDDVVRYTIAISSSAGARNVLHEGIRCGARRYKTYAYGGSQKVLVPRPNARWERFADSGVTRYRRQFYTTYFCGPYSRPYSREEILNRLRNAGSARVRSDTFVP